MKRILLFLLLTLQVTVLLAQTTPNCTSVAPYALTRTELTPAQITQLNNDAAAQYPNATRLANASATYNCHFYAWNMTQGGPTVWINTPGDDQYWLDGSYVQTTNTAAFPAKVSYASDDHSAVTTATANILISKWGSWPLMQHNKNYTPYNSTTLKYYVRNNTAQISGSSALATTAVYSVTGAPAGATITWSVSPSGIVSQSCTNCSSVTLTRITDGTITLTANVTACGNTQTLTKTVYVCSPPTGVATGLTGTAQWQGTSYYGYTLNFTPVSGATSYYMEWFSVTNNSLLNTYTISGPGYFYYYFSSGQTYKYRLAAINSCGAQGPFSDWSVPLYPPAPPAASCSSGPIASTLTLYLGCGSGGTPGCPYTNLSWPAISGASQYGIEYIVANVSSGVTMPTSYTTSSTPYPSVGLPALTGTGWTLRYRVRANCSGTWGNYSGWSSNFFLQ